MKIAPEIQNWCHEHGYGEVISSQSVGGGCINQGSRLDTASGQSLFLKSNPSGPEDMFQREAEGLIALAVQDGPRVPEPLLAGAGFLLLEDLQPASPGPQYWPDFGRKLALLHKHHGTKFGFEHDNYLGSTPQPNPWSDEGYAFFEQHRLMFQAELASKRGLLDAKDYGKVERIALRLPELVPEQPPSLIHGDLWSGNAMAGSSGEPAIIDPATHYGWAEAELGMTALFGGFRSSFYEAYLEVNPLDPGWEERLPLYNLYHLLNHLNLFGSGYLGQLRATMSRFA